MNNTFVNVWGRIRIRLSGQELQISSFLLIICAIALFVNDFSQSPLGCGASPWRSGEHLTKDVGFSVAAAESKKPLPLPGDFRRSERRHGNHESDAD